MTDHIAFVTPGEIPIRAFTHFGINSKPNAENPIGYFGTGLKYALAVLARIGWPVVIMRGRDKYTLELAPDEFRGKDFNFINLIHENDVVSERIELPYTTELGKNWDAWQIFRELYANTLDEGGAASIVEGSYRLPVTDATCILVGGQMADEYKTREKTFLPEAKAALKDARIQIVERSSKFLYYRGLRVVDLQKPSALTYNILRSVDLTEDRTAKFQWQIDDAVKAFLALVCDDSDLIETALAGEYESELDFSNGVYSQPSEAFKVAAEAFKARTSLQTYVRRYEPQPITKAGKLSARLKAWISDKNDNGDLQDEDDVLLTLCAATLEVHGE